MRIFIEDSFDSAHYLPNVPRDHKCANMHGHTYRVRLEFGGAIDSRMGWIVDYAEVKRDWDQIKALLDHQILNQIEGLENPTCELLVKYIARRMPDVSRIELRETERCGVVWEVK